MEKNEIIGHSTRPYDPDAKCGLCGTKEDLVQWETPSKMMGILITRIQYTCRSCAKEKGMTIPEE